MLAQQGAVGLAVLGVSVAQPGLRGGLARWAFVAQAPVLTGFVAPWAQRALGPVLSAPQAPVGFDLRAVLAAAFQAGMVVVAVQAGAAGVLLLDLA